MKNLLNEFKAKAVSPAHITGFFKIYKDGSTGAGINLENGMKTKVEAHELKKTKTNSIEIHLNGKNCPCNTSRTAAKKMLEIAKKKSKKFRLKIIHETIYPIGYGLGISGAGALSLSLALNKALKLNLSKKECMEIAKFAEISNGTGLGDVIAEQAPLSAPSASWRDRCAPSANRRDRCAPSANRRDGCGAMIGAKPYPSKKIIPIPCNYKFIVCGFFAPIKTKTIIRSKKWKKKINEEGKKCMHELNKNRSFDNLMKLSREFSFSTGLPSKKLLNALKAFPVSSMAMLGQTIFIPSRNPKHAQKRLKEFTSNTLIARIAEQGAKAL